MRPIDMTARPLRPCPHVTHGVRWLVTAVIGLALAMLAACGSGTPAGSPAPSAPPIVSPPTTRPPVTACPANLVVPAAANSRTLCVASGGTVTITAPPDQAQGWLPFDASGNALAAASTTPAPTGSGKVLAAFKAIAPGTSAVTSSHRNCPSPAGVACHSIALWRVTIVVK